MERDGERERVSPHSVAGIHNFVADRLKYAQKSRHTSRGKKASQFVYLDNQQTAIYDFIKFVKCQAMFLVGSFVLV